MTTNLLTNYIHNVQKPTVMPKQASSDVEIINVEKRKPDFDINRELANRTFIKPLPSKARLVKSGIFDAPAIFVKDAIYDVKALKSGWKGDANDHQLGKLNDLGMKLGGLAIAAYLFTKKQTPTTKAMEFIGLGSFFASMALWPKLALQLPARLIHGYNVMPEYEDSYGRKKPFYQDNLFIPWDVYEDKEIQKIGDRLGVPKDIPNRREAVQEKMRKIALQNNTMWMLTAGFATPIMSALICNALEQPTTKLLDKYYAKKADKMLIDFSETAKKAKTSDMAKSIETLIEFNKEKTITPKMIKQFANALGIERDMLTVKAIENDLTNLFLTADNKYTLPEQLFPKMVKAAKEALEEKFDSHIIDAVVPDENQIMERLKTSTVLNTDKVQRTILGQQLTKDDMIKIFAEFDSLVRDNIKKYNSSNPAKKLRPDSEIPVILKRIHGKNFESGPVSKLMLSVPSLKFDSGAEAVIRYLTETMTDFTAEGKVLDKYLATKFGATSNLANFWNETDSSILKILNFTDKELQLIKDDRMLVTPMLREKLENIASDETEYKRVVGAICEKISKLGETIKGGVVSEEYIRRTNEVYETAADKLRKVAVKVSPESTETVTVEMPSLVKQLVGFDELLNAQKANPEAGIKAFSQKDIQVSHAQMRLKGVKSSFDRILNALDCFRRTATLRNIEFKHPDDCHVPLEVKDELINAARELVLDAHMADFETKFYIPRNLNPDNGTLTSQKGKLVFEYFDKAKNVRKVEIPADPYFFNNLMTMMFGGEMHPDTKAVLEKHDLNGLVEYRDAMMHEVGDTDYFAKMYHKLFTAYKDGSKATSESKFNRIAKSFTDLIYDAATKKYNTNKWLKIFGTAFGVLTGITVASQFFFGKMRMPEQTKKG